MIRFGRINETNFLKKRLIAPVLLLSVLSGCLVLGPTPIEIAVTGGGRPVIQWKGGPVTYIAVERADRLVQIREPDGSRVERHPVVWGYRSLDDTGKFRNGISSPVSFGSVIAHCVDISDSAFRADTLAIGVEYRVRMVTTGPGSVGNTIIKR